MQGVITPTPKHLYNIVALLSVIEVFTTNTYIAHVGGIIGKYGNYVTTTTLVVMVVFASKFFIYVPTAQDLHNLLDSSS